MRGIAFRIVRIKQRYPLFSHAQQQPFVKITHHIKASIPTKGKLSFQPEIPTRKAGICGQKTPCADLADQAQNKPEQHQQGYQNSNSLKIGSPGECSASPFQGQMRNPGFGMQRGLRPLRLDSGRRNQRSPLFPDLSSAPRRHFAVHVQPSCLTRSMGLMISVNRTPNFSLMTTASPRATSLPLT